MGSVVQGALGSASNLVGGLPIVGGMAKSAIGQGGSMLGMPPQGGQQGGQPGGLMGGKGGGQGGPGQMLGGLMGGGKGGQQNPFSQFAQGAARFSNNQNPFGGGQSWMSPGMPGSASRGGGYGGGTGRYHQQAPDLGQYGGGYAANGRALKPVAPTAQTAQLSDDFKKQYGQ